MNTITVLFGLILCLIAVNGRNFGDRDAETSDYDEPSRPQKELRHRRRRWQSNFGYDYSFPPYYQDRRDFDRSQDYLPQIYKLLEEIASNLRRPQLPPPQPIYVPYPVPYPVRQYCSCGTKNTRNPNVTSRFPDMEDINQNWGFVISNSNIDEDDDSDGSRPISFVPLKPLRPNKYPSPPVQHGSSQDDNQYTTQAPKLQGDGSPVKSPGLCNAAVLSCCGYTGSKQRSCFTNIGCNNYDDVESCSTDSITAAIDSFKAAYQPA